MRFLGGFGAPRGGGGRGAPRGRGGRGAPRGGRGGARGGAKGGAKVVIVGVSDRVQARTGRARMKDISC